MFDSTYIYIYIHDSGTGVWTTGAFPRQDEVPQCVLVSLGAHSCARVTCMRTDKVWAKHTERDMKHMIYTHIHIHIHTCIYIYIYMYM